MPTSDFENKQVVRHWYEEIKPKTVLDIGAGEGTYSKLVTDKHGARWMAVEAFAPYVADYGLESLYDQVIVADVNWLDFNLLPKLDLIIIGDVLEHMEKATAQNLINKVLAHTKHLIISIPVVHLNQGAVEGNTFEIHKDHWGAIEMEQYLGDRLHVKVVGEILGYFWAKGAYAVR